MLQVRFHGRGGHGVKTASRILGTAAFLEGWYAQDFPVYGAERRGAAVMAFTRVDRAPILERGIITRPHFLIIADETLLRDPAAGALAGLEAVSAFFVNSTRSSEAVRAEFALGANVQTFDLTALTAEYLHHGSNLSAALGAVACGLTGIVTSATLERAVCEEIGSLGLATKAIDANVALAQRVFAMTKPISVRERVFSLLAAPLHPPQFEAGPLGVPIIYAAGNSAARKTGAWRIMRPVIDLAACTRCLLCLARCPEGVMALDEKGYPQIDYDHCKGCMICAQECPLRCIREEKEVRAW